MKVRSGQRPPVPQRRGRATNAVELEPLACCVRCGVEIAPDAAEHHQGTMYCEARTLARVARSEGLTRCAEAIALEVRSVGLEAMALLTSVDASGDRREWWADGTAVAILQTEREWPERVAALRAYAKTRVTPP